jgi:hypothetical protein
MVKHIIIWTLKNDYDADEKMKICANIKNELEALKEKIDGIMNCE